MNIQSLKLIFKGRLEFGSQRTFDMVLKHWQARIDTYFKADILFKAEQIFLQEGFALVVPQQTVMSTEKCWRSTTALLNEVAQFAVVGNIWAWCVDNGQLLSTVNIEPHSDKVAVLEYRRGCDLVAQEGRENEATVALSRAIEKYERHALAYERRGYVNYKLKNFNDSLHDFSKSIDINQNNPEPFYGRGKVKMLKNDWEGAIQDFESAIKRSIALQPIHWLARLKKGESLFHAKKFQEAAAELQLHQRRAFCESDPNHSRRSRTAILLGKALVAMQDVDGAMHAFQQAKGLCSGQTLRPSDATLLHRVETPDFMKHLKAAVRVNATEAVRMLEDC